MRIVIYDKNEAQVMSGMRMFSERLIDYLRKHGHEVYVLRYSNGKQLGRHIYPIPFYIQEPRSYIVIPSERTYDIVIRHLKRIKPDIVYAYCGMSPFDYLLPSLCHRLHIPIAAVWHTDINESKNTFQLLTKSVFWAYLPFCSDCDLLHVFSEKLKQFYVRRGINSKNIIVLPNGVNPEFFRPGPSVFGRKNNIQTGVLFLGRLTLVKDPELLIKSFLSLNTPLSTKLVVVGHGEQEEKLRNLYHDPRVIFTGLVTDETQKLDIMRACRIFAQPSKVEGMSLALLESMATGLAGITSDAGNNRTLLENAGTIIPLGKIKKELPRTLRSYISNPALVRSLGNQARKNILSFHVEDTIYGKLVNSLVKTADAYRRAQRQVSTVQKGRK